MSNRIERTLPCDINAEAAVLSAMIVDNYSVARAIEILHDNSFYKTSHKLIFNAITKLFEENIEIDVITLINKLEQSGNLEKSGGRIYISELSDLVLSGANIEYHANIVLEKALLRDLITASNSIIEKSYKAEQPVNEIVDSAEQAIFKVAERPNQKTFVKIADILPAAIDNIEEIARTKTATLGVPTGFGELDKMTGGFKPGQLIVLAARPAMGKTSFALNIAFSAAFEHEMKVAFFTMEMASEELLLRMISFTAEVPMDNILKGYGMDEQKLERIASYSEAMSKADIYIDDNGANTALDIRAKTRRLKAEIKGLDLILIDYLQLMSGNSGRDSRQQEIAEISRSLKVLAKEIGCPVIALSQLNRGLESRDDKRPKLSDLRESGAIEQDADIVMFIYRDDYYNPESEDPGLAEIILGKNRHGATGKVKLRFVKDKTKFQNLDSHRDDHF